MATDGLPLDACGTDTPAPYLAQPLEPGRPFANRASSASSSASSTGTPELLDELMPESRSSELPRRQPFARSFSMPAGPKLSGGFAGVYANADSSRPAAKPAQPAMFLKPADAGQTPAKATLPKSYASVVLDGAENANAGRDGVYYKPFGRPDIEDEDLPFGYDDDETYYYRRGSQSARPLAEGAPVYSGLPKDPKPAATTYASMYDPAWAVGPAAGGAADAAHTWASAASISSESVSSLSSSISNFTAAISSSSRMAPKKGKDLNQWTMSTAKKSKKKKNHGSAVHMSVAAPRAGADVALKGG
ncbi:uncharacterized protein V1510DRAFT_411069 [Dipodascopsis tothii]|uniref:uncharacterized protein n=1 Tax=Dipodascopsis tothii TaxID=44089 RepID=UPI0034CDFCB2